MRETITSKYLRCDDHAETLEFTRIEWDANDIDYEINIVDAYCGGDRMGIAGRFRRAWHAFWAKPIYHNSIYVDDPARVKKFLEECLGMMEECKDHQEKPPRFCFN